MIQGNSAERGNANQIPPTQVSQALVGHESSGSNRNSNQLLGHPTLRNGLRVVTASASENRRNRQPLRSLSMRRERTDLPTINEEHTSQEDDGERHQEGSRFLSLPRPNLRIVSSISAN